MKTLSQHNQDVIDRDALIRSMRGVDVACDDCGTEMIFSHKTVTGTSGQWVRCPNCKTDKLMRK